MGFHNLDLHLTCPKCLTAIYARLSIDDVAEDIPKSTDARDWKYGLTESQLSIIDIATQNGLLLAFGEAVKVAKANELPTSLEKFFLTFLATSVVKSIPAFALHRAVAAFPGCRINYIAAQGVGAFLADGNIRWFVPAKIIEGYKAARSQSSGSVRTKMFVDESGLTEWIRTSCGYVAFKGALYQELQSLAAKAKGGPRVITNPIAVQGGLASGR